MIKILNYTENPLTTCGMVAGICYDTTNPKRFPNIAKRCLEEGHGRISEFADVILEIDGYSAKMIRELYTMIIGTSRVQASTRYIDYSKFFDYIKPKTVANNQKASILWDETMVNINKAMLTLKDMGVPVEDFTNLLPLAYQTKMVLKINLRALIHMFHVRACTCAYWEYRDFMKELKQKLSELDDEWKFIADKYFVPKCIANGYCDEKTRSCGLKPLKIDVIGECK